VESDGLDVVIFCDSLSRFLAEAPKVGHCFRCLSPVDPSTDEWSTLAQANEKVGNEYLIGGILCEDCVGSWGVWLWSGETERANRCD